MYALQQLFDNNRAWSERIRRSDPEFFQRLSRQQRPRYLWIGCADSRVPANEIVGLQPGELFVHRNVANVVVHSDLNCLSVMQFAVQVLQVEHIIVVGHYGCGGVGVALRDERVGIADNWLRHVQDVHAKHASRTMVVWQTFATCSITLSSQTLSTRPVASVSPARRASCLAWTSLTWRSQLSASPTRSSRTAAVTPLQP